MALVTAPDPYNILGSALQIDPTAYGEYGPAIESLLSLLRGPNYPAMAKRRVTTGMVDPAAANFQSERKAIGTNLASRSLTGSGIGENAIGAALGSLRGT